VRTSPWTYNGIEQDGEDPRRTAVLPQIVVDEQYTLKISRTFRLRMSPPLLCAGITTTRRSAFNVARGSGSGVVGWRIGPTWRSSWRFNGRGGDRLQHVENQKTGCAPPCAQDFVVSRDPKNLDASPTGLISSSTRLRAA